MEPAKLKKRPGAWEPYLFLAPAMLLLFIFKIYPIIISFAGSFFAESFLRGETYFAGLDNYTALFTDPTFYKTLKVTLIFNLITTPLQILISLLLALSVRVPGRANSAFRSVFMMPIAIALSSGCMIWNTHDVRNAGPALFYQPETVHDVSHPYLYLEGLRLLDALSFVRHSGGIRIPD